MLRSVPSPARLRRGARRRPARPVAVAAALLLVVGVAVLGPGQPEPAGAFGSVNLSALKQQAVHEPITRTLSCRASDPVENCWQRASMSQLAGREGTFGGVGEPDNPLDGSPNPAARHCDNVDWGYDSPNTYADAQRAFTECLTWYQAYMDFAAVSAGALLNADGSINAAQTDILNGLGGTYNACKMPDPQKGNTSNDSAKCNVITGFGRALHLYEDFWSHSNWADLANPAAAIGLENPVGLDNTGQPAFFAYPGPRTAPIEGELLTGCDDSVSVMDCVAYLGSYPNGDWAYRTGHSKVNKDNGVVNPDTCTASAPVSVRGKVVVGGTSNFQRAVTGACGAARRAWSDLQAAIVARYGADRGTTIIRAISHDTPLTACAVSGGAAKALSPPVGDVSSARSVAVRVVNETGLALTCRDAVLDGGEWASYPTDVIGAGETVRWRTQSNGMMTGTEGRAVFAVEGSAATVDLWWNNPYIGSNDYSCSAGAGFSCSRSGGSGNDSTVTFTIRRA